MNQTRTDTEPRPLIVRILRFIVVTTLTAIRLYIEILVGFLGLIVRGIKKIPLDGEKK